MQRLKTKLPVLFRSQAAKPCRILRQERAHKWSHHLQVATTSLIQTRIHVWTGTEEVKLRIPDLRGMSSAPNLRDWCFHSLLKLLHMLSLMLTGHTLVHSYHYHVGLLHSEQLLLPLDSTLCFLQAASSFQKGWQ